MSIDPSVRRQVLASLLLGFVGPVPPRWLLTALEDGLGGVVLFGSNVGDGTQVRALTDALRSAAGRDIVIALDEEGGDVTRLDATRGSASPGAAALGQVDDETTTAHVYAEIGRRLGAAGVTMDLAPVADVNVDPLNPVIGLRSFSADPHVAARHVAAAVRGLQSTGVAACVKHFPGHGATRSDSHHEVAVLDRSIDQLRAVEFAPFRAAVAAGTRAIMTGHLVAPALDPSRPATVSPVITTEVLRGELGFTGSVVTDALEMKAVASTIGIVEGFVAALIAGADTIETGALNYPELVEPIVRATQEAWRGGRLTAARLDDAAQRTARLATPAHGSPRVVPAESADPFGGLEVSGELPTLRAPVVVECRPPGGMASGDLPWSLGDPLTQLVVDSETFIVHGDEDVSSIRAKAHGRTLVVVVRDPERATWQQAYLDAAECHGDSVIVDAGWPLDRPGRVPVVRTRGIAPGLLAGAAALLAGRPVPTDGAA